MVALIALGHGSRHQAAQHGVDTLAAAAGQALNVTAYSAYLDLNQPSLVDVARSLVVAGHRRAVVVPLLFTTAFHSKVDVPAAVQEAKLKSGLHLELADGLGVGQDIARILAQRVARDAPTDADIAVYSVGTGNKKANHSVADLGEVVAGLTGRTVHVVAATFGDSIEDIAAKCTSLHIVPLFVTEGVLLDRVVTQLPYIATETGTAVTASKPLTVALTDIVADRYRSVA
jgi:hypothetical protein